MDSASSALCEYLRALSVSLPTSSTDWSVRSNRALVCVVSGLGGFIVPAGGASALQHKSATIAPLLNQLSVRPGPQPLMQDAGMSMDITAALG